MFDGKARLNFLFLSRTGGTLPKHGHPNLPGRVRGQDLGHCDQSTLQVSWPTCTQHLGRPDLHAAGCLGSHSAPGASSMFTPGIRIVYHFWYTNASRPYMRTTLPPAGIEPVHVRAPLFGKLRSNGAYVEAAVALKEVIKV